MEQLVDSASTFLFDNAVPMIGRVFSSLPSVVKTGVKKAVPKIKTLGRDIVVGLKAKREAEAKVDKVDVVPQGWGSPTEVFEHALEHERHVSRLIDELVHLASEEKDNATRDFLWGFVREQVEEEANFLNIVNLMKKAGESGILFMDAKLGERQS